MALPVAPDLGRFQPVSVQSPAILTHNLTKKFGEEIAVNGISFEVPRGAIFGFIGPSGSGKTTTIRLLTGVSAPTSGEVLVLGEKPSTFNQKMRARLGYMPQLFVLYPHLTVWENLNFAASIYGISLFRRKLLNNVLDLVELREHKNKLARQISGGMQRRLSLAATLVHKPELIFLDEPTAGVDPVLRRKFWDHFKELQTNGQTLFVTTQYVSEASYCDWIGVMAEGRLITVSTPAGLRQRAYGGEVVDLRTSKPIEYHYEQLIQALPFVRGSVIRTSPNSLRIIVDEAATATPELLDWARNENLDVEAVEPYLPPFEDVFVELVKKEVPNAS